MEKISQKDIEQILKELCEADPSLLAYTTDLERVAHLLVDANPEAKPEASFISKLQIELHSYAQTLMKQDPIIKTKPEQTAPVKSQPSAPRKRNSLFIPFSFAGASIAIIAIAVIVSMKTGVGLYKASPSAKATGDRPAIAMLSAVSIHSVEKNAFGSLAAAPGTTVQNSSVSQSALGMGGGGGYAASAPMMAPVAASERGVANDSASVKTMMATGVTVSSGAIASPPQPIDAKLMMPIRQANVEYTYKGDDLKLDQTSMDVLRLAPSSIPSSNITAIVGSNLGIADVSSFSNLKATDVNLVQDIPFGYNIYIGYQNGTISINQNWEKWQSVYPQCQDDTCWKNSQLKTSDVPADEELVKMANDFLDQHRIDRSSYGTPEVDKSWQNQNMYGSTAIAYRDGAPIPPNAPGVTTPEANVYVPDSVQVLYPLMIQGKPVYNGGGTKVGMTVGVNLRAKRVSDVNNIRAMQLDASAYDANTNADDVLAQAKKGGYSGYMYMMDGSEAGSSVITDELGTPTLGYIQIYTYKDNQSSELYVPALIFPVTTSAATQNNFAWMHRNVVIVPLVKGVIDESNGPGIRPMMLNSVSTGGGTSGSAGSAAAGTATVGPVTEPSVPPTPSVAPAPVKK